MIGADQVLALGDEIYEKPASIEIARQNLLKFRGRTHHLHAAVCVAKNGETIWHAYGISRHDHAGFFN